MEHVIQLHAFEEEPGIFRASIHDHTYDIEGIETSVLGSTAEEVLVEASKHLCRIFKIMDDAYVFTRDKDNKIVSLSDIAMRAGAPKITPKRVATVKELYAYTQAHQLTLVAGPEVMQ